jgi:hypothetical protein
VILTCLVLIADTLYPGGDADDVMPPTSSSQSMASFSSGQDSTAFPPYQPTSSVFGKSLSVTPSLDGVT